MSDRQPGPVREVHGTRVLVYPGEGPVLAGRDAVLDVIADAWHHEARWVVLPARRLDAGFFRLRTGVAGEFLQKLVQYRIGLAVVGDISAHLDGSSALRDLVRESNKGDQAWFLPTMADFDRRLGEITAAGGGART
jgi:hypothetical protein